MAKVKKKNLTPKQEGFCQEYIIDLNVTRAYQEVYKCSLKAAESNGARTIRIDKVRERIAELRTAVAEKLGLKAEDVLSEFMKVAYSNMGDFIEGENQITNLVELSRDKLAAVESIQTTTTKDTMSSKKGKRKYETKNIKLKLHSKLNALENLGKHLGIYGKDNSQKVITLADIAARAMGKHAG